MVDQISIYILLFSIIVLIGQLFDKTVFPVSLILVIVGMFLSFIPIFTNVSLNPEIVLNVFLPLLIYQISAFSSWKDVKRNVRPIALLSFGHVIFITILVAVIIHAVIPQLSWPFAFILGAVISPPDDVAIVAIAEKIRMPMRIVTILEGEAMFNDVTALLIFRFALAAIITHQFSLMYALNYFIIILICESAYALVLGWVIGELRLRISNPVFHTMASLLTPFLAYYPAEMLGGSGILATAIVGFIIGHKYSIRFSPDFRLFSWALWPTLSFGIQNILFLFVGLNMYNILENISSISFHTLLLYSGIVVATVVLGRFIWVYGFVYFLPRILVPAIRRKDPYPPWQYPFVISWAGMRGAISLAAVLAVPKLPFVVEGANSRDLLVFLVICVIAFTLLFQGLTLPWLLKILGVKQYGQREKYDEHLAELLARLHIIESVLDWLPEYKQQFENDYKTFHEINLYIQEFQMIKIRLKKRIETHDDYLVHDHDEEHELLEETSILAKIIEFERLELLKIWQEDKINLTVRNKLIKRLDHQVGYLFS